MFSFSFLLSLISGYLFWFVLSIFKCFPFLVCYFFIVPVMFVCLCMCVCVFECMLLCICFVLLFHVSYAQCLLMQVCVIYITMYDLNRIWEKY